MILVASPSASSGRASVFSDTRPEPITEVPCRKPTEGLVKVNLTGASCAPAALVRTRVAAATNPENLVRNTDGILSAGPRRPCRNWAERAQTGPHNDQCGPDDTPWGFPISPSPGAAIFAQCRIS